MTWKELLKKADDAGTMEEELLHDLKEMAAEAEKYEPCMSLIVDRTDGHTVELLLDSSLCTYSEWIKGEGADIGLMRCRDTGRVVGVRLPLMRENLAVDHDGPIRINAGFRKGDQP